jgi:bifunctional DNA-binding transcriptional regulator/antitoxin component of YhaV-PrlF toxin-antitoxin module
MDQRIKMDANGSITIPPSVREACRLKPDEEFILEETPQGPLSSLPVEMYTDARLAEFAQEDADLGTALIELTSRAPSKAT